MHSPAAVPMRLAVSMLAVALLLPATPAVSRDAAGLGEACAGFIGRACKTGLWCDLRADSCGGADIPGRCIEPPLACTGRLLPVCGCDGKTYSNDCWRQQARVTKKADGACGTPRRR